MRGATILSPWAGTGALNDPYIAQLARDFPTVPLEDITRGVPGGEIPFTVEIRATPETLALIAAHADYSVLTEWDDA